MRLSVKDVKSFLRSSWLWVTIFLLKPLKSFAQDFYDDLQVAPEVFGIAPIESKGEVFLKTWRISLCFFVIMTTVIGVIWYFKNKASRKWFQFFVSKTFFVSVVVIGLICAIFYWLT